MGSSFTPNEARLAVILLMYKFRFAMQCGKFSLKTKRIDLDVTVGREISIHMSHNRKKNISRS